MKLRIWFLISPRWFALPVALAGVLIGAGIEGRVWDLRVLLALLVASTSMAAAHTANSYLDYTWTKLDRGEKRSKPKPYTTGQSFIAEGKATPTEVLLIYFFWLFLGVIFTGILSTLSTPLVWLPFLGTILCSIWYSKAKLLWHPEVPLGIGFGPLATLLGSLSLGGNMWVHSILSGIPLLILFGFAAEAYDQWYDADQNWESGLRSIGALAWKKGWNIWNVVAVEVGIAMAVHLTLYFLGVFNTATVGALVVVLVLFPVIYFFKNVKWGLFLLGFYALLVSIGVVGGGHG